MSGDALCVIAHGKGDYDASPFVAVQVSKLGQGAAFLERGGLLKPLELDGNDGAGQLGERV